MEPNHRVLVVEDDPTLRRLLAVLLERRALEVSTAADGDEAIAAMAETTFGAIVLDLLMPKSSGFDVLRIMRAADPALLKRVVVVTGAAEALIRDLVREALVWRVVRKPIDVGDIGDEVVACLRQEPRETNHLEPPYAERRTS